MPDEEGHKEIQEALAALKSHENPLYHPSPIPETELSEYDYFSVDNKPSYIRTDDQKFRICLENNEGDQKYNKADCRTIATYLRDKGLDVKA
ncbi:MAG: hypothetical protein QE263_08150 [Vampirovibrionales bacterium]|nr:hypothetical protein [Vampirovibrionales bacterium]